MSPEVPGRKRLQEREEINDLFHVMALALTPYSKI
jgi:hypothetical protein